MSRYSDITKISEKGISRLGTADLPVVEENNSDVLLITVDGDRCDLISQQYYGTPEYWWFIASTNNLTSNNIAAGTQISVRFSLEQAILK